MPGMTLDLQRLHFVFLNVSKPKWQDQWGTSHGGLPLKFISYQILYYE